jgi:hypothetical protein
VSFFTKRAKIFARRASALAETRIAPREKLARKIPEKDSALEKRRADFATEDSCR